MSRLYASNFGDAVSSAGVQITDDGTYRILKDGAGNILLKVRKSDGQLLISGGLDTDQTL